jgi:hypothetical protein
MRGTRVLLAGAASLTLMLTACTTDAPEGGPDSADGGNGEGNGSLTPDAEWFDQAEFDAHMAELRAKGQVGELGLDLVREQGRIDAEEAEH